MKKILSLAAALSMIAILSSSAMAAVTAGDVINKSNWQSVDGMVPNFVLDYVKNGKMEMVIGKLNYDKKSFKFPSVLNSASNEGKYGIDDGILIDVATKKYPVGLAGIPFPNLKTDDPNFGYKAMYNWRYNDMAGMHYQSNNSILLIGNEIEKDMHQEQYFYRPGTDESFSDYDYLVAGIYRKPYDMSGLAVLEYKALNPETTNTLYVYLPGTRKMRRLKAETPGSEMQSGFDFGEDEMSFGGPVYRIGNATYKVLGVKEMLVPHMASTPVTLKADAKGNPAVIINTPEEGVILGAQKDGNTHAPWALTNVIWVPTQVAEVESIARNENNYQYGTNIGWVDLATGLPVYKFVTKAKSNEPFKHVIYISHAYKNAKEKVNFMQTAGTLVINKDRNDHSTFIARTAQPGNVFIPQTTIDERQFTREGFARFCQ